MTTATFVTGDALPLLSSHIARGDRWPAVFTSLPDAAEMGMHIIDWRRWFRGAAFDTIEAVEDDGFALFYQTDRRVEGHLESKAGLIVEAALEVGARVVWHKIAVRRKGVDLHRPSYTHLIAVSRHGTAGRPTPDVFDCGGRVYRNATDDRALEVGLGFLWDRGVRFVADPFCGRGSIAHWAAQHHEMDTLSIDIDPAQVRAAAELCGGLIGVEVVV